MLGTDVLEDAGFRVIEAAESQEAFSVLEADAHVDVLFTDVDLGPGKPDGFELARRVHARWPEIQLVITSGHVRPRFEDIPDDGCFVSKPYQPKKLVEAIRAVVRRTEL